MTKISDFSPMTSALRILAADAVEKAASGHPGAPMGMAEIAQVLWTQHLRHNPGNPRWTNRDRFVLSNGHGSMLLYALLHLTGYPLSMEDIQNFRQLHAKTPGHPEYDPELGIETTTGPLGQGLANAVGMAIAEKTLAAQFNQPGCEIIDHHTYAFVGDGCLMEGISHESCSLAGTLKLGKLIVIYDDNNISIDGETSGWFTDNTAQRFQSYGWQVIEQIDGHDQKAIDQALHQAKQETDKPTLICAKTRIGKGSPNKAGTAGVHGSPLGADEISATRKALDWQLPPFAIPQDIYNSWDCRQKGEKLESVWTTQWTQYRRQYPELADELTRRINGDTAAKRNAVLDSLITAMQQTTHIATRKASQHCLESLAPALPELLGGSADLTGSNLTNWSGSKTLVTHPDGNYIHYGVREFAMVAIANGIALHGGFIPYCGTFLVFSDYARNAMRMSALMGLHQIFVMTHDSIGLGEDGPTHQPIEHLASLRIIPNMHLWRPCDAVETAIAWNKAIARKEGPSTLALSRQGLANQQRSKQQVAQIGRGGYILAHADTARVCLIATGSEVEIAMEAKKASAIGKHVQVVSMPSVEEFLVQPEEYRQSVLPDIPTLIIEAAVPGIWHQFLDSKGAFIGINTFGKSAPAKDLFTHFQLTVQRVVNELESLIT